ncbi:MAG: protein kinase [Planctomycetes bacterium]|nr:protein kinase [Planctomycetota bacterium]
MSHTETLHNLLAGLLALNDGWITPSTLVAALSNWGRNRTRSLGDILIADGALDATRWSQVESRCTAFLQEHAGNLDQGLSALSVSDSLRQDLLQLADPEITGLLTKTQTATPHFDPYATREALPTPPVVPDTLVDPLQTRFGTASNADAPTNANASHARAERYRILRLHAKGGLGLVSVAEDQELPRQVALKEIQAARAFDQHSRRQFVTEAEITARLEHPGIVPIYGLGQHADGRPYYAMRFIRGKSLRDAITEYYNQINSTQATFGSHELEFRKLLGSFLVVCNTIEYAHSRRILHRDLKPANVMLGDYGETLVVDWGLAADFQQVADHPHPIEHAVGETGTRTAIGTPQYMSPEQSQGQAEELGPATDIYSLGATLYEILTGTLRFSSRNMDEMLQDVALGRFPTPRVQRPACPRALEAICLKALAVRPEDRYPSAGELARDVERWLADEPVLAYHENWSQRIARWMRRHRSATQATAVALIAVTVVALAASLLINGARRRESRARQDATQRSQQAREVIDTLLTNVGEALENYPGMQDARRRLLERAAADYVRLTEASSSDPELRAESARAYTRLGDVRTALNQFPEADAAYHAAEALWTGLLRETPRHRGYAVERAAGTTRAGLLLATQGQHQAAQTVFSEAIAALKPLVAASPAETEAADALGTALVNLGLSYSESGQQPLAEQTLEQAVETFEALIRSARPLPRQRYALAKARNKLGRVLVTRGAYPAAIPRFRQAEEVYSQLVEEFPGEADYLASLAATRVHLAAAFRDSGLPVAEADLYQQAADDFAKLLVALPDVPRHRENLAVTLTNLGQAQQALGQNLAALEQLRGSLARLDELAEEYPSVSSYLEDAATTRVSLASVLRELNNLDEAEAVIQRGLTEFRELIQAFPGIPRYRARLGVALGHAARIQMARGAHTDAATTFQLSITDLTGAIAAEPLDPHFREDLSAVYTQQAWFRQQTGDEPGCRESQKQAITVLDQLLEEFPTTGRFQNSLGWQLATGPTADLHDLARAQALATQATTSTPDNRFYWCTLGTIQFRQSAWQAARESLAQGDRLTPAKWGLSIYVQAQVAWQLGNQSAAKELLTEAQDWHTRNRPGDEELGRVRTAAQMLIGAP